jgi:prenyltransferase beta subunit
MTIRLDMCRTVSRAADALGDSLDAVRGFLRRQLAPDGGFQGRNGRSDLYYTVFGLEASLALGVDLPFTQIQAYLAGFAEGESLDLVHLAALVRCRANMAGGCNPAAVARASRPCVTRPSWSCPAKPEACTDSKVQGQDALATRGQGQDAFATVDVTREAIVKRLLGYRSTDGGFNTAAGAPRGNAYGSFLALSACQDLGLDLPGLNALAESIRSLQRPDGGYSNEPAMAVSATPATAAALSVLHYLKQPVPQAAVRWLLDRAGPQGGFAAIPLPRDQAIPDLLSTATALHALSLIGAPPRDARDRHLDYLDSLWSSQGGFRGHWGDDMVDCEYTYYGLLSLGCLVG